MRELEELAAKRNVKVAKNLGRQLRLVREKRGLSIAEVAEMHRAEEIDIERVEDGSYNLNMYELRLLCIGYACSLSIEVLPIEDFQ